MNAKLILLSAALLIRIMFWMGLRKYGGLTENRWTPWVTLEVAVMVAGTAAGIAGVVIGTQLP